MLQTTSTVLPRSVTQKPLGLDLRINLCLLLQSSPLVLGTPRPDLDPVDDPENSSSLTLGVAILDPNTSASTPAPMPVDQTITPSSGSQDALTVATPVTAPVIPPDQNPDMGSLQARSLGTNWAMQAALTWLFAQVIPALGSLTHSILAAPPAGTWSAQRSSQDEMDIWAASADTTVYTPIPLDGCVMIPKSQYPTSQTDIHGSSSRPIFLSNDTDSGISSIDHSTPVKALGVGHQTQHLTSTPKSKLKLLSAAQQQTTELVAKRQGAPHGAHMKSDHGGAAQANSWGNELRGWHPSTGVWEGSLDSSIVSLDDHTQFTTKHLMERDDPSWNRSIISGGDDIELIHDSSDAEMISNPGLLEQHSEDSSPDSTPEDAGDPNAVSVIDPGSSHHSDSSSDLEPDPGSNLGSEAKSSSGDSSDSSASDDGDGGDFGDMFLPKKKAYKLPLKRPESRPQSSSCSQSWDTDSQKRPHTPSPENEPNPDKPDQKKKKPTSNIGETPKSHSKSASKPESAGDKIAWEIGEDLVRKFREEEDK